MRTKNESNNCAYHYGFCVKLFRNWIEWLNFHAICMAWSVCKPHISNYLLPFHHHYRWLNSMWWHEAWWTEWWIQNDEWIWNGISLQWIEIFRILFCVSSLLFLKLFYVMMSTFVCRWIHVIWKKILSMLINWFDTKKEANQRTQ